MASRRWLRTGLSSVFVLFLLAAGHLLMVVVNAAETAIERPGQRGGLTARMFTDVPLSEELENALRRARTAEQREALQTVLARAHAGEDVQLQTLPVTTTLWASTLGLTFIGVLLMWLTSRLESDGAQTLVGLFAGNFLWTGAVEYGLTIAARTFGLGKAVAVVDGTVVAVFGEYVLLKHSWGALALVMAYLVFLESSRCPIFLWWRERVPTMRGPLATGRIDNYGPRTAFQYATTVWGFYLLLLWAYDDAVFGVHGLFTSAVFMLSLASTGYLLWRLHQQEGWGKALRYAVGAMIVAWTPLEVAGKWGLFREPWLLLQPSSLAVFFGGLTLGTWMLWRAQRRPGPTAVTTR